MNATLLKKFHSAVLEGNFDAVKNLLPQKMMGKLKKCKENDTLEKLSNVELNVPLDNKLSTPLHFACKNNFGDIVCLLIANGADVNAVDNLGMTPLQWVVCQSPHIEANALAEKWKIIECLITNGADLSLQGPNDYTMFLWLCANGDYKLAEKFLSPKIDDWKDGGRIVGKIKKEIDITKCDRNGNTPLMIAAERGHSSIVEQFKDYKNYINKKNNRGMTALMFAVISESKESVQILLENDADINIKAKNGLTALDFAEISGNIEIIKMLENKNAEKGILKQYRVLKKEFTKNKKLTLNQKWQNIFMFILGVVIATSLLSFFTGKLIHLSADAERQFLIYAENKLNENLNDTLENISSIANEKIGETLDRLDINFPFQKKFEEELNVTLNRIESKTSSEINSNFNTKVDDAFSEIKNISQEKIVETTKAIENELAKRLEESQSSTDNKLATVLNTKIDVTLNDMKKFSQEKTDETMKVIENGFTENIEKIQTSSDNKIDTVLNDMKKFSQEKTEETMKVIENGFTGNIEKIQTSSDNKIDTVLNAVKNFSQEKIEKAIKAIERDKNKNLDNTQKIDSE